MPTLILAQRLGQLRADRDQPAFEELAAAHIEQPLVQVHIAVFQIQRFTQTQTRTVEQQQQRPHRLGRDALGALRRRGLEQASQLDRRIDIGREIPLQLGGLQGQGRPADPAAGQGEVIETS